MTSTNFTKERFLKVCVLNVTLSISEFLIMQNFFVKMRGDPLRLNPFVPNAPFLYPLKTSENLTENFIFSRSRERAHWGKMG